MANHAAYWRDLMDKGHVVAFGPVADGTGAYGIGIVQFEDETAVRFFADNDPTIKANVGFKFEVQPMPRGVVTPS